jgi:hypothetical protein
VPSRIGKVYQTYPYTLKHLLKAIDDARFRSFADGAHLVAWSTGSSGQSLVLP